MKNKLKVKIIDLNIGVAEYLEAAAADPEVDLDVLWNRCVVESRWSEWAAGQFNEERTKDEMNRPATASDKLADAVVRLRQIDLEAIVARAFTEMTAVLPPPEDDSICVVCILADPRMGENVAGVAGTCIGGNMLVRINPAISGWEKVLPWVLAHEYHHSVWGYHYFFKKGNTQADLLTGLIIDGQADSFAQSLNRDMDVPWVKAIDEKQEREQWTIMQDYLDSIDGSVYCRFFFGEESTKTPACTAYTIGYHIVQAYLKKHPEQSFTELLDVSAREILDGSGYPNRIDILAKM